MTSEFLFFFCGDDIYHVEMKTQVGCFVDGCHWMPTQIYLSEGIQISWQDKPCPSEAPMYHQIVQK